MNRNIVAVILLALIAAVPSKLISQPLENDTTAPPHGHLTIVESNDIRHLNETWKRRLGSKTMEGYRIQLYNGNKSQAFEIRSRFVRIFPEVPSTIVYETPEYKTQVGNYRNRLEAQHALNQIRKEFKGAFLVKTKIDLPDLKVKKEE